MGVRRVLVGCHHRPFVGPQPLGGEAAANELSDVVFGDTGSEPPAYLLERVQHDATQGIGRPKVLRQALGAPLLGGVLDQVGG